jgi:hypothetical protein
LKGAVGFLLAWTDTCKRGTKDVQALEERKGESDEHKEVEQERERKRSSSRNQKSIFFLVQVVRG